MEILFKSPLGSSNHKYKKRYIFKEFPFIKESGVEDYLCFFPFTKSIPAKYYNKEAFVDSYDFLRNHSTTNLSTFKNEVNKHHRKLSLAFQYLNEINTLNIHDNKVPDEEIDLMLFIDNDIHYNLLKLIEGVYSTFLSFITHFIFVDEGKNPQAAQNVSSCIEKLRTTKLGYITKSYSNTIRNGIAHGDFTFGNYEIIYRDSKGNEERKNISDIVQYFDDLIDLCNGISLGFRLFFISGIDILRENNINIPRQIMLEEIIDNINFDRWRVKNFIEAKIGEKNQLVIFVENNYWEYISVLYLSMHTAVLAEKYASGFDRYFLSLKCKYAYKGSAGYDGKKLEELRLCNCNNLQDYAESLENKYILFFPRVKLPNIFNKILNIISIFKDNFKYEIDEIRTKLNRNIIDCRYLTIHRNGAYSIINGNIVLIKTEGDLVDTIHSNINYIVKKIIKEARKQSKTFHLTRHLRVGYLRVGIFTSDMRKRTLYHGGLRPEFLCAVELKRIKRINVPDLINTKILNIGKYKIFWHNNWQGIKNVVAK